MRTSSLLCLSLLVTTAAGFSFNFQDVAKACATAATCAALLNPLASVAKETSDTSIKIDLNTPYLVDMVKSTQAREETIDRFAFLAQSVQNAVGPAVSVTPPTNIQGFTKKALSGEASVEINGQTVGVQVVESTKGALTVKLSNPLIPPIPFAGLPTTPGIVNRAADVAASAAPGVAETLLSIKLEKPQPFWNRPINEERFRLDIDSLSFHRAFTPVDVVGGGSLVLGGTYAASYAYYIAEQEREATQAANKKKELAAKREAAQKKKTEQVKPKKDVKKIKEAKKVAELVDKVKMEDRPEKRMEAINKEIVKKAEGKVASDDAPTEKGKKRDKIKQFLGF